MFPIQSYDHRRVRSAPLRPRSVPPSAAPKLARGLNRWNRWNRSVHPPFPLPCRWKSPDTMARQFEGDQGRGCNRFKYYDTSGFGGRRNIAFRRDERMNIAVIALRCLLGAYVLMWAVLVWFL